MAGYGDKPFGLRQLKITDADGTNAVTLPVAQTLKFDERIDVQEFIAEGRLVAAQATSEGVEWELEAGGLSLEVYAKLTGRTAVADGTTPTRTLALDAAGNEIFPYVRIYGRAVGDGSDDVHCKLFRCVLTKIGGEFADGAFWATTCEGLALPDDSDQLFQFVQHETGSSL